MSRIPWWLSAFTWIQSLCGKVHPLSRDVKVSCNARLFALIHGPALLTEKIICFNFLEKLKLCTKLGPDTVCETPISFHIKIYLWSLVDYQHLQKYFYNWNITLNYYFICKINIRGNFIYLEMPLVASNAHILTPLFRPL